MQQIFLIAKRELSTFFDSLIAYILLVVFLGLSGFFTWVAGGNDVFLTGQASIQPFFAIAYFTLFFFVPALTMRTIAEERNTGTIELLLTKDITDWQLVLGKFLGCVILVSIAILCSLPYYFTVAWLGPVDHGAVWCGYLGILLLSMAYTGIGIFASSVSNNQIVAFLLSLSIGVFFLVIFGQLAQTFQGILGKFFHYLTMSTHYEPLTRGVVDFRDVVFFVSIAAFGLVLARANLLKRQLAS
ncbi:MAG: ABC transporter permease subunit [Chitinophagales bacterium]|jgi:ABC-2 type transport system permease protein|nr:ABC transporter permease subunit [Chitinophagales bacterium]HNI45096.1 ABC transporter permease subunit [Chitinophagales bacterium]HNL06533.1 ABC transporter permease subunit [Chitinophagales bacterium]